MVKFFGNVNETVSEMSIMYKVKVRYKFDPGTTTRACNDVELIAFNITLPEGEKTSVRYRFNCSYSRRTLHESSCRISCGPEFKVFRKLDNNYFTIYYSAKSNMTPDAELFAKSVPPLSALGVYVNNINEFKDKVKIIFVLVLITKLL